MHHTSEFDLLDLAESVARGERSVADAERLAGSPARAAEVGRLVGAIRALRGHADAWAVASGSAPERLGAAGAGTTGETAGSPVARVVPATRPSLRRSASARSTGPRVLLVAATVAVLAGGLALAGSSLIGPRPSIAPSPNPSSAAVASVGPSGSPSPTTLASPTASPAPSSGPSAPSSPTPSLALVAGLPPIPTVALPGAPGVAIWRFAAPTRIQVLAWRSGGVDSGLMEFDTWADTAAGPIQRSVLASPSGAYVAVAETRPDGSGRVRLFASSGSTASGRLLWTDQRSAGMPALAWAPSGDELAVGYVPAPWLVVQVSPNGSAAATTYNLEGGLALALLGFNADGTILYGYDSSGEAAPWQKPYMVDLARGFPTAIDAYPDLATGGAAANTTTPLGLVDPQTGAVLDPGGPSGLDTSWSVRRAGTQIALGVPVPGTATRTSLLWAGGGAIASLAITTGGSGQLTASVGEIPRPVTGAKPVTAFTVGAGSYRAVLHAATAGYALVGLVAGQVAKPDSDWLSLDTELVLVELANGRADAFSVPGDPPRSLRVAGFLR